MNINNILRNLKRLKFSKPMSNLFNKKGNIKILITLYKRGGSVFSKYELNKKIDISWETLNKPIQFLEKKGLIKIKKNTGLRRSSKILLTELGEEIAKEFWIIYKNVQKLE